jgi:oxygen-independent coproporphyrinogen-3 oxidase
MFFVRGHRPHYRRINADNGGRSRAGRRDLVGCRDDLEQLARDGLTRFTGSHVSIPPESRPFPRLVAAAFDACLEPAAGRHSAAD